MWDMEQEIARQNMETLSMVIRGALAEMRSMLHELRSDELQNQTLTQLFATLVDAGRHAPAPPYQCPLQVIVGCPVKSPKLFIALPKKL